MQVAAVKNKIIIIKNPALTGTSTGRWVTVQRGHLHLMKMVVLAYRVFRNTAS